MRRARVDLNQREIVDALRRVGAVWVPTWRHGDGTPDGWVWFRGKWTAMEIKQPGQPMTEPERFLYFLCSPGIRLVHSVDEALAAIGAVVS